MAPRSHDIERTKAAYKVREFRDKKKRSHYTIDGREYLFGEDKCRRHDEIKARAHGYCELKLVPKCGTFNNKRGNQWHHDPPRSKGGDDSMKGGIWACPPCHRAAHNREVQLRSIPALETWTHPEGTEP